MNLIYADFMKVDSEGRLILSCRGTHDELERRGTSLRDGLSLVFYNDDEDEFVDEEEAWVSRETDECLYELLSTFEGEYSSDSAQWIIAEITKRGLPIERERSLSLKYKELEVAVVA